MHQSSKEKQILSAVNRSLQNDRRESLADPSIREETSVYGGESHTPGGEIKGTGRPVFR